MEPLEHEIKKPLWKKTSFWAGIGAIALTILSQLAHLLPPDSPAVPYVSAAVAIGFAVQEGQIGQSRNAASATVEAARISADYGGSLGQVAGAVAPVAQSVSDAAQSVQGAAQNVENVAQDVSDVASTVQAAANIADNFTLKDVIQAAAAAGSKATFEQLLKAGKIQ